MSAVVKYAFLLGLLIAALATACKTKTVQTVTDIKRDSTHTEVREVLRAIPVTTPPDSAAIKAMVICPDGAEPILIYKHDTIKVIKEVGHKQASVGLALYKGSLTATANCNELEQLVYAKDQYIAHYSKLYEAHKNELFKTVTLTKIPAWCWYLLVANLVIAAFLIARLLIKYHII